MKFKTDMDFIDDRKIEAILVEAANPDKAHIHELIAKAKELKGLTLEDTAVLLQADDPAWITEIGHMAREIKEVIYGNRLVLFAPLNIANHCLNICLYCGFRRDKRDLKWVTLTLEEISREVEVLEREGHKRILMLWGDPPTRSGLEYFLEAIATAYAVKTENGGEIRCEVFALCVSQISAGSWTNPGVS